MNVPANRDEVRLVRWAAIFAGTILASYLWWALGLPAEWTPVFVVAVVGQWLAAFCLGPRAAVATASAVLVGLLILSLSISTPTWDARTTWLYHARRIFLSGSLYDPLDGYPAWSHPDYPVLGAAWIASLARGVGHWNEVFPKSALILLALPPVFLFSAALRSPVLVLSFAVVIVLLLGRNILEGNMDGLLALYFTAGTWIAGNLCGNFEGPKPDLPGQRWTMAAAFSILAIMPLLKNEGIAALLSLTLALSVIGFRGHGRLSRHHFWFLVAVALLPLLAWKIACARAGIHSDLAVPGYLDRLISRLSQPGDAWNVLRSTILRPAVAAPLILLLAARRWIGATRRADLALLASAFYLVVLLVVFLTTPADIAWHLRTSAGRVVQPVALLLCFACLEIISQSQTEPDAALMIPGDHP